MNTKYERVLIELSLLVKEYQQRDVRNFPHFKEAVFYYFWNIKHTKTIYNEWLIDNNVYV
mgnify:CR=1|jgi:hypothetical protein